MNNAVDPSVKPRVTPTVMDRLLQSIEKATAKLRLASDGRGQIVLMDEEGRAIEGVESVQLIQRPGMESQAVIRIRAIGWDVLINGGNVHVDCCVNGKDIVSVPADASIGDE